MRCGVCRDPRQLAPPACGIELADRDRSAIRREDRDGSRVDRDEPEDRHQERALARSARAGDRDDLASPEDERRSDRGEEIATRLANGDVLDSQLLRTKVRDAGQGAGGRFRRIDQLERGAHRLPPLLACVEVKPELTQRQVGLRCEDEDEQAGPQIQVACDQSETHPDGDEGDRQRGEELEREGGQERDAQRRHRLRPGTGP